MGENVEDRAKPVNMEIVTLNCPKDNMYFVKHQMNFFIPY